MLNLPYKWMSVFLLTAFLLIPFGTFAQQTKGLEDYRKALQQQQQGLLAQYGKDLETTMVALKQKGDLDTYLVFDTEKKRFDTEQTVSDPADVFDAFRPTVETYHKSTIALLKKYVTALDGLLQKLMMANRIEDAKEVKKEKENAISQISLIEAKFPKQDSVQAEEIAPPVPPEANKAVTKQSPLPGGRKPIPEDAESFKDHHYKLFTDGAAWEKAAFRCRTLGGHLVVITDSEENDFVYNLMHDQMVVWIGASKDMGTWRWCTTSLFEYQNWAPGQPDSGKVMGFKAVMCGDGPWGNETRGHWDDRPGERTNRNENKYNPHSSRNYSGGYNGPSDNYEVTGYVCEWDY